MPTHQISPVAVVEPKNGSKTSMKANSGHVHLHAGNIGFQFEPEENQ